MRFHLLAAASLCALAALPASAQSAASKAESAKARAGEPEFRALYKELVEINTTLSVGSCTKAAEAMKARLVKAGYAASDLHMIADPKRPQDGNLIADLAGTDKTLKPVMLLAHI